MQLKMVIRSGIEIDASPEEVRRVVSFFYGI